MTPLERAAATAKKIPDASPSDFAVGCLAGAMLEPSLANREGELQGESVSHDEG